MNARGAVTACVMACAAAACAVEVEVHGHVYGAVTDDFAAGEVGPEWAPEAPPEQNPSDYIVEDADPAYDLRWEADVGLRALFTEEVTANLLFTFDDRKQSKFYRYELFEPAEGAYYLSETGDTEYVYASLEQANVKVAPLWQGLEVTLGGYDVRYGHGGYYNGLVNRIDPVSFVAYLDPFGVRAEREFGRLAASLAVGAGLERQAVAAASCRLGNFGLYAAAEGRSYDLKSLWDSHYAAGLPSFYRHLYRQERALAAEPRTFGGSFGDTIHAGVETSWELSFLEIYGIAAYHKFADDEAFDDPTGGTLIQVYPDFGLRLFSPRVWVRGAILYEAWRGNYHSTFADDIDTNDSLLFFGEPEYFFAENAFFGLGARYLNPSRRVPDDPVTTVRENSSLSVAALPHLSYAPAENVKIDVTYAEIWWDPSYDVQATEFVENRSREIKLEIEALF